MIPSWTNWPLLGNSLLVSPAQIGSEMDLNRVFYFDLPIVAK